MVNSKSRKILVTRSEAIVSIILIVILSMTSVFFVFVVINQDALKAMIEAEATILGFFGLVIVYLLNSIDTRIERIAQTKDECKIRMIQSKSSHEETAE